MILIRAHSDCQHGGRDKTSAQVRQRYSWWVPSLPPVDGRGARSLAACAAGLSAVPPCMLACLGRTANVRCHMQGA